MGIRQISADTWALQVRQPVPRTWVSHAASSVVTKGGSQILLPTTCLEVMGLVKEEGSHPFTVVVETVDEQGVPLQQEQQSFPALARAWRDGRRWRCELVGKDLKSAIRGEPGGDVAFTLEHIQADTCTDTQGTSAQGADT